MSVVRLLFLPSVLSSPFSLFSLLSLHSLLSLLSLLSLVLSSLSSLSSLSLSHTHAHRRQRTCKLISEIQLKEDTHAHSCTNARHINENRNRNKIFQLQLSYPLLRALLYKPLWFAFRLSFLFDPLHSVSCSLKARDSAVKSCHFLVCLIVYSICVHVMCALSVCMLTLRIESGSACRQWYPLTTLILDSFQSHWLWHMKLTAKPKHSPP